MSKIITNVVQNCGIICVLTTTGSSLVESHTPISPLPLPYYVFAFQNLYEEKNFNTLLRYTYTTFIRKLGK